MRRSTERWGEILATSLKLRRLACQEDEVGSTGRMVWAWKRSDTRNYRSRRLKEDGRDNRGQRWKRENFSSCDLLRYMFESIRASTRGGAKGGLWNGEEEKRTQPIEPEQLQGLTKSISGSFVRQILHVMSAVSCSNDIDLDNCPRLLFLSRSSA